MNILSVKQFDRKYIEKLFADVDHLKNELAEKGSLTILSGKVLANIFYEPSTRTSSSFHAAMLRLGGNVIPISASSSSVAKGESLSDTIKTVQCYADVIVLRHPAKGAADEAARTSSSFHKQVPIINAGDGTGEHPTQALLDIYTIYRELLQHHRTLEGITITLVGDLKHGRTVHSLARVLALFKVYKINYISPKSLRMPQEIIESVTALDGHIQQCVSENMEDVVQESDIIYMTRIQKERFENLEDYESVKSCYCISSTILKDFKAKDTLSVLHPLPRIDEISPEFDSDPRAAYFRQVENGMYVRMALLCQSLGISINGE